jgi:ribosomal protein L15
MPYFSLLTGSRTWGYILGNEGGGGMKGGGDRGSLKWFSVVFFSNHNDGVG